MQPTRQATMAFALLASLAAASPPTTAALEAEVSAISGGAEALELQPLGPLPAPTAAIVAPFPDAALAPSIGTAFGSVTFDDNFTENGFYSVPPDPIGAAGTDRLVAVTNHMIEARSKTGTLLWRDSLMDFFTSLSAVNGLFDPKIVWDHYEGRFVVVALEKVEPGVANPSAANTSRVLLAVSKTASPASATTSDWYYTAMAGKFTIGVTEYWADFPGLEIDEEAVYVTNNLIPFKPTPHTANNTRLWIVNKGVVGGFYAGAAATVTTHDPYASAGFAGTTMPCLVYGAGGVGTGIGTFLLSYGGLTAGELGGAEFVQIVRVDSPLSSPTFVQSFLSVGDIEDIGGSLGFPDLPDAPQSGTAVDVEVGDRRALDCVWRSNEMWLTTTIAPNSGTDSGQTTAHWFRLGTSAVPGGAVTVLDQGNIGGEDIATTTYTFFPSVALNSLLEAKFGFAASAGTIFAGAYATGRQPADAAGTVQSSVTVAAGLDYYVRLLGGPKNRWGDYSGASLDPTNDNLFWLYNEYAMTRGTAFGGEDGRWATTWASCSFPTATTTSTVPSTTNTSTSTSTSTSSTIASTSTSSSSSSSTSSTITSTSTSSTTTSTVPGTTTTTIPGTTTTTLPTSDIGVSGRKLVIVDKLLVGSAKLVFVSKDTTGAITKGTGEDVEDIDIGFSVAYPGSLGTAAGEFVVPAGSSNGTEGWKVNKATVAKYVNAAAPAGSTATKVAVVKPAKLLKLVAKGLGDGPAIDLATAGDPIGPVITVFEVTNGGQTFRHCSKFDPANPNTTVVLKVIAAGAGRKLIAKGGEPTTCP
jgi:hypothetical protein